MLLSKFQQKPSFLTIIFLAVLLGFLKFNYQQTNILSYDYFGLYLHLPATFIYHDPAIHDLSWLEQINNTYQNTPSFYQIQREGDYNIIRFFCGMAMLLSPFFFLGHAMALLSGAPADGFSYPYQLAMMIAAWFYVVLGLIFMRKVLLRYFTDKTTAITLVALYLGTNLLFWTTFDAGAPHTILFSLYAILLWVTIRWHESQKTIFAAAIGLVLGLIIVSRPSDIVAVFIPLLWGVYDKKSLLAKFELVRRNVGQLVILIGFTALAGLPQLLYFHHFTGHWVYSTYNDPQSGFDFTHPRFAWVLFSFRKGWLIYAPLMIFSILGFIPLLKKHKVLFAPVIIHFLINLFLIASFTSLISYGWRAFIQSYALLALPLAALIAFILRQKWPIKTIAVAFLAFFIWLSAIQSWQIINEMIDPSRMTKAYYLQIFGKLKKSITDYNLLLIDPYLDDKIQNKMPDKSQFDSFQLYFNDFSDNYMMLDPLDSTNYVFRLSAETPYSPGIKQAQKEITNKDHIWLSVSFDYLNLQPIEGEQILLVVTYLYDGHIKKKRGKPIKYRTFGITDDSPGNWEHFTVDYLSPELISNKSKLQVYIWSTNGDEILIDNLKIEALESNSSTEH